MLRKYLMARRREKRLTQADVARQIGVTRNTIVKLESGLAVDEGIESAIEKFYGWKIGSLDRIRNGGEPEPAESGELSPRDDFERTVINSRLSWERKLYWIQQHREISEAEDQLLRELGEVHPKSVAGRNGVNTKP